MKAHLSTVMLIAAIVGLTGCARFTSTVTERGSVDGTTERITVVRINTFFDSKSELAKMSSGQTDKSPKVSIGSLNQESSGTNAVNLVASVVGAALRAAVRP